MLRAALRGRVIADHGFDVNLLVVACSVLEEHSLRGLLSSLSFPCKILQVFLAWGDADVRISMLIQRQPVG